MNTIDSSKAFIKEEIGIVISDKTLCLGIDLPVRSSCFWEWIIQTLQKMIIFKCQEELEEEGWIQKFNIIFYGNIDYLSL